MNRVVSLSPDASPCEMCMFPAPVMGHDVWIQDENGNNLCITFEGYICDDCVRCLENFAKKYPVIVTAIAEKLGRKLGKSELWPF